MLNSNNEHGRSYCIIMGVYFIVKAILNMILGGTINISGIISGVAAAGLLFLGIQYVNYAVAAVLVVVALVHLPGNIRDISSNWIYLAEGIIDIVIAVCLVKVEDIKEHFTSITMEDLKNMLP